MIDNRFARTFSRVASLTESAPAAKSERSTRWKRHTDSCATRIEKEKTAKLHVRSRLPPLLTAGRGASLTVAIDRVDIFSPASCVCEVGLFFHSLRRRRGGEHLLAEALELEQAVAVGEER